MGMTLKSEYAINGVERIFEFYFFINPIGGRCRLCQKVLHSVLNQISANVSLNIIPYHNQEIVESFLERNGHTNPSLELRNEYFELIYQTALAYKAATMQGRKRGRYFLDLLQAYYIDSKGPITEEHILDFAREAKLDLTVFNDDQHSDYVRRAYVEDQRLASEMKIRKTPSVVIYEHSDNHNGLLIEGPFDEKEIIESLNSFIECIDQQTPQQKQPCAPQLRLISNQNN